MPRTVACTTLFSLFRIMLNIWMSRGSIDSDNNGANYSFYLYVNKWYFTISPENLWSNVYASLFELYDYASIDRVYVYYIGGVQF